MGNGDTTVLGVFYIISVVNGAIPVVIFDVKYLQSSIINTIIEFRPTPFFLFMFRLCFGCLPSNVFAQLSTGARQIYHRHIYHF